MDQRRSKVTLGLGALVLAAAACQGSLGGSTQSDPENEQGQTPVDLAGTAIGTDKQTVLDERNLSFTDAIRTASLKLTDNLPSLQTIRDIEPGGEVLIDYCWPADASIRCRCGAPNCRGWIVDPDELHLLKDRDPCREETEVAPTRAGDAG